MAVVEHVRVPAECVRSLDDEQLGMLCRGLLIAWERGQTKQRHPNHGQRLPLSESDLKWLTRRGRIDEARRRLGKLGALALSQLRASWTLEGPLVGALLGDNPPKQKAKRVRDSRSSAPQTPITTTPRAAWAGAVGPPQGQNSPAPRECEQPAAASTDRTNHQPDGLTPLATALGRVINA